MNVQSLISLANNTQTTLITSDTDIEINRRGTTVIIYSRDFDLRVKPFTRCYFDDLNFKLKAKVNKEVSYVRQRKKKT